MTGGTTCGEALVALLESYGVDVVFGIPGVHTLDLYDGLARGRMRVVTTRHEQGAGFMADGYARVTGRPGVCFVITGPGVTNVATALGQAYSDSIPMLVISSVNERKHLGKGRGRLHEITCQRAVTAPLSAFSATALAPEDVPEFIARAFAVFEGERPRPVHIEIPIDVLGAPAEFRPQNRPAVTRPAPSASAIAEAVEQIAAAQRPVIVAGGGAAGCGVLLRELTEKAGAALVLTTAAKGAVPEDHPLCVGSTLAIKETHALLARADLVVAVGTELAETDLWAERLELGGRLVRIDIDPRVLHGDYRAELAIQADAGTALEMLVAALGERRESPATPRDDETFRAARDGWRATLSPKQRKHAKALDTLRAALPADAIVFTDATQIAYFGNSYYPCRRPRTWFHPVGYGTLGWALPAAIGAKLAPTSAPVIALAGDFGFQFTAPELGTAVELGLPLPIVLWNNDGLGEIRDSMEKRGSRPVGVEVYNPDFLALARAYGCGAVRPESLAAFADAVRAAASADRPTLIELREDAPYLS
ncbi:MAG: 5-guanidino-2-oxopentanoate decarboxylase [Alphaproteobacteria bacterium]